MITPVVSQRNEDHPHIKPKVIFNKLIVLYTSVVLQMVLYVTPCGLGLQYTVFDKKCRCLGTHCWMTCVCTLQSVLDCVCLLSVYGKLFFDSTKKIIHYSTIPTVGLSRSCRLRLQIKSAA